MAAFQGCSELWLPSRSEVDYAEKARLQPSGMWQGYCHTEGSCSCSLLLKFISTGFFTSAEIFCGGLDLQLSWMMKMTLLNLLIVCLNVIFVCDKRNFGLPDLGTCPSERALVFRGNWFAKAKTAVLRFPSRERSECSKFTCKFTTSSLILQLVQFHCKSVIMRWFCQSYNASV